MSAARACLLSGGNYITREDGYIHLITNNRNGNYASFRYIDFGDGKGEKTIGFTARIRTKSKTGIIEIIFDDIKNNPAGSAKFENMAENSIIDVETTIENPFGIHEVFLKFSCGKGSNDDEICDIFGFNFENKNHIKTLNPKNNGGIQ